MSTDRRSRRADEEYENGLRGRVSRAVACGLVAGLAFFALRSSVDIIWDDTPQLSAVVHDPELTGHFGETTFWSDEFLGTAVSRSFRELQGSGYRPLSMVLRNVGLEFFREGGPPRVIWIAFVAVLVTALGTVTFLVARRFTQTDAGASLAVLLFLCSPPFLCSAWVVFAGIQTIVPLVICSILLLYWRLVEGWDAGERRPWTLAALVLLMFLGPWFREFIGLGAALVMGLEVLRRGRPTWLAAAAVLSLVHAIFPTSIVRLIAFPELPLVPIHRMGSLGTQLEPEAHASPVRWEAIPVLLFLIPSPILLTAAFGASFRRSEIRTAPRGSSPDERMPLAFLWVWFALSFVPFLKLFVEHVHLLYALLPLSILLARGTESLGRVTLPSPVTLPRPVGLPRPVALRWAFLLLVGIGVADRVLEVHASWRTTRAIIDGYEATADRLLEHATVGDVVVANFIGGEEVRHHADGFAPFYFTVRDGVPHPSRVVREPERFEELLRDVRPDGDVLLLAADFDYLPSKALYHTHVFAKFGGVPVERLGVLHTTRTRYAYADPLKAIVPREWMAFPASPDLVNDFYLGPTASRRWFTRELHADYELFRVVGDEVDDYLPSSAIRLVDSLYRFNLLECNGRYFAIHQAEGPFDIGRALRREYDPARCSFADSRDAIVEWIERQAAPDELARRPHDSPRDPAHAERTRS